MAYTIQQTHFHFFCTSPATVRRPVGTDFDPFQVMLEMGSAASVAIKLVQAESICKLI